MDEVAGQKNSVCYQMDAELIAKLTLDGCVACGLWFVRCVL